MKKDLTVLEVDILTSLRIKNYISIDYVSVDFSNSLNSITGETGAGKSTIIESLLFLIGMERNKTPAKDESMAAEVVARFNIKENDEVKNWLSQNSIPIKGDELEIKRTFLTEGKKTVSYIANSRTPLKSVREIAELLYEVNGQHSAKQLLEKENHIEVLSQGIDSVVLQKYKTTYEKYISLSDELLKLIREKEDILKDENDYDFYLKEIDKMNLKEGEDQELLQEYKRFESKEELISYYREFLSYTSTEEGALFAIYKSISDAKNISALENKMAPLTSRLEEIYYEIKDIRSSFERESMNMEFDEERQMYVEERLVKIDELKRKIKKESVKEIIDYKKQLENRLTNKYQIEDRIIAVSKELNATKQLLEQEAQTISELRADIAKKIEKQTDAIFAKIRMPYIKFKVSLTQNSDIFENIKYDKNGKDNVEFLISSGQSGFRPIKEISSGGELSRLLLTLKSVLNKRDHLSLIFDEIDSGIGGETAVDMGFYLKELSSKNQIICITHQAPIAAFADRHFLVKKDYEKNIFSDTIYVSIFKIDGDDRVLELSRMIGSSGGAEGISYARELLKKYGG